MGEKIEAISTTKETGAKTIENDSIPVFLLSN
jgi:hypothetical protein